MLTGMFFRFPYNCELINAMRFNDTVIAVCLCSFVSAILLLLKDECVICQSIFVVWLLSTQTLSFIETQIETKCRGEKVIAFTNFWCKGREY